MDLSPMSPMSLADAYVMAWLDGLNRRAQRPPTPLTLPPRLDDTGRAPVVPLRRDQDPS